MFPVNLRFIVYRFAPLKAVHAQLPSPYIEGISPMSRQYTRDPVANVRQLFCRADETKRHIDTPPSHFTNVRATLL